MGSRGRAVAARLAVGLVLLVMGRAAGVPAHALVPHALAAAVPRVARRQREGHREVRRDHDRHPRREGVPQGGAQRRRVRRRSRATTATSTPVDPAVRHLRARPDGDRQRHRRGRAAVGRHPRRRRRIAGDRRAARGVLYVRHFFSPLQEVALFLNSYQSATAALEKVSGVLEEEPTRARPGAAGRPVAGPRSRAVRGRRVRVRERTGRSCRDFYLDIPAGQTIALVGTTGAGKSTLAKLVSRFYDPTRRRGHARRRRPAVAAPEGPAPRDRHGHAGGLPVQRLGRRQHRARQARRDARRDRARPRGRWARTSSSRRCPTATTPT